MKDRLIQTEHICLVCNNENSQNAQYCIKCGQKIIKQKSFRIINLRPIQFSQLMKLLLIKNVLISIILMLSFFEIFFWFVLDAKDKMFFIHYYSEINEMLWIAFHARLIAGIILSIIGICMMKIYNPLTILICKSTIILLGILTIFIDFLAIPGLLRYGEQIDYFLIINDLHAIWLIMGVMQISIGFLLSNKVLSN